MGRIKKMNEDQLERLVRDIIPLNRHGKLDYRTGLGVYGVANGFRHAFGFDRISKLLMSSNQEDIKRFVDDMGHQMSPEVKNDLLNNEGFRDKFLKFIYDEDIPLGVHKNIVYNLRYKRNIKQKKSEEVFRYYGRIFGYPEVMCERDIKAIARGKAVYDYYFFLLDKKKEYIGSDKMESWVMGFNTFGKLDEEKMVKKIKSVFGRLSIIGGVRIHMYRKKGDIELEKYEHDIYW